MLPALIVSAQAIAVGTVPYACTSMLPLKLVEMVAQENPGFDLPRETDAGPERLKQMADSGSWPCPYVVVADFDGNGWVDRALLLKSREAPAVRLIAALNLEGKWQPTLSQDWPIPITAAFLHPLEPGLYQNARTTGGAPAAELDRQTAIQSDYSGFSTGEVDGRTAAYFFQQSTWRHVWLSE